MCFTRNNSLYQTMVSLRNHGQGEDRYENIRIGINGRLDTLQAAILLCKFEIFPQEIEMRHAVATRYSELLPESALKKPVIPEGIDSAWAQYSLLAQNSEQRKMIQDILNKSDVPTAIYYPKPLHMQKAFSYLGYHTGDFPVSENCSERIFSLPMHPYLREQDQQFIAEIIINSLK